MKLNLFMRRSVKKLIAGTGRSTKRLPVLFHMVAMLARLVGVDEVFMARARDIWLQNHSPANSLRFLSTYIRLKTRRNIGGFSYNLAAQLETEDEKNKTLELLREALSKSQNTAASEALKIQIFRLEGATYNDPDIKDFIHSMMKDAIWSKAGQTTRDEYSILRNNGIKAIASLQEIFTHHNKRFFLVSGTLLGAVRDKGIIKNDNDIDLGIFADEISNDELKQMLAGSDFFLRTDHACKTGYLSKSGVALDFFVFRKKGDRMVMCNQSGVNEWSFTPFTLAKYPLQGHEFLVPDDYELCLRENYGNWRIRTLFYDYAFDVPCNRFNDNSDALLRLTEKLCLAIKTGDRFTVQETADILKHQFKLDMPPL